MYGPCIICETVCKRLTYSISDAANTRNFVFIYAKIAVLECRREDVPPHVPGALSAGGVHASDRSDRPSPVRWSRPPSPPPSANEGVSHTALVSDLRRPLIRLFVSVGVALPSKAKCRREPTDPEEPCFTGR